MGQALGQGLSAHDGAWPLLVLSMFVDQFVASPIRPATGNLGQGWSLGRVP